MRRQGLGGDPWIASGVQHRHRFGRAAGHIPTGDMDQPRRQRLAGRRIPTREQRAQLTGTSGAFEAQRLRAAAGPLPRRLAAHRVVVLGPAGDLALVVLLVPSRELAQAHHGGLR